VLPRSFKVVDFGVNRKGVCVFLLVRHSNFGPISHSFGAIAVFLVLLTQPYATLIFFFFGGGVFSLHQIAHIGVSPHTGPKLFGLEIIFGVLQPV